MPWDLIIAGAIALTSGTVNAIGQSKLDDEIYGELEDKKDFIDAQYKSNKEKAALDYENAKDIAKRDAADLETQAQYKEYLAERGEENAKQTDLNADITDAGLNVKERSASTDFNAAIDQLYLQQAANTYSWNNALMQSGSQTGAAYANLAGAGVRSGSSLSNAVLMEGATNAAQLQFSQDAARRSENASLAGVLSGLAGNRNEIWTGRYGADAARLDAEGMRKDAAWNRTFAAGLRDDAAWKIGSFEEGGYNYNLYQNQLTQMKETYDYNINQITKEKNKHSNDTEDNNKTWNVIGAFFGGANKGYTAGYNLADSVYKSLEYRK